MTASGGRGALRRAVASVALPRAGTAVREEHPHWAAACYARHPALCPRYGLKRAANPVVSLRPP